MRQRLEEKRWSYGDVARRGGLSKSTVHHFATAERPARMPHLETLRGLARGLELPLDIVRRAAAQSCGIYVYGPTPGPEIDVLIASVQQLSVRDRQHVAALVESLLARSYQDDEKQGDQTRR
jgi:transcriptional regulator with XRE-family HTH domain